MRGAGAAQRTIIEQARGVVDRIAVERAGIAVEVPAENEAQPVRGECIGAGRPRRRVELADRRLAVGVGIGRTVVE